MSTQAWYNSAGYPRVPSCGVERTAERKGPMTSTRTASSLPPGPRLPKALSAIAILALRERATRRFRRRYGDAFTVELPVFGPTVVLEPGSRQADVPGKA